MSLMKSKTMNDRRCMSVYVVVDEDKNKIHQTESESTFVHDLQNVIVLGCVNVCILVVFLWCTVFGILGVCIG